MASNHSSIHQDYDEPSLDEMFEEPIVQLIMKRDGVNLHDMRSEMNRMVSSYAFQAA